MNPRTLKAWLCAALLLLTRLAPAAGFVVCIEPDGCVRIEVKAEGSACSDCKEHDAGAPDAQEPGTEDDSGCPCKDILVPANPNEQRPEPRAVVSDAAVLVALPVDPATVAAPLGPAWTARPVAPRVESSLARIRSVVLLV